MKFELESHDIKAIAEQVEKALKPWLLEILEAANHKATVVQKPQVVVAPRVGSDMVKRDQLPQLTGLSTSTLWRLECKGDFPRRVKLSHNRVGWHRSEVVAWVSERQAA